MTRKQPHDIREENGNGKRIHRSRHKRQDQYARRNKFRPRDVAQPTDTRKLVRSVERNPARMQNPRTFVRLIGLCKQKQAEDVLRFIETHIENDGHHMAANPYFGKALQAILPHGNERIARVVAICAELAEKHPSLVAANESMMDTFVDLTKRGCGRNVKDIFAPMTRPPYKDTLEQNPGAGSVFDALTAHLRLGSPLPPASGTLVQQPASLGR